MLRARGHDGRGRDARPTPRRRPRPYPVRWASRRSSAGRAPRARARWRSPARRARADVVYTTGMLGRSALGAPWSRAARTSLKLTADPAFERAVRCGLDAASLDDFQRAGGARVRALRARARRRAAAAPRTSSARARRCASSRSAGASGRSASRAARTRSPPPELGARDELRARHGLDGPTLAFAGRLTAQKSLDVALDALARADGRHAPGRRRRAGRARSSSGTPATLGLDGRVRFLGPQPRRTRARALPRGRRGGALLELGELPAHGRRGARGRDAGARDERRAASPRSCATARTGCSSERATPTRSPPRSAATSRTRSCASGCARPRRRPSTATRRPRSTTSSRGSSSGRRREGRLLLVGRTRYRLPLDDTLRRKFDALARRARRARARQRRRRRAATQRHLRARPAVPAARARRRRCSTRSCRSASRASSGASGRRCCSSRARTRPRSRSRAAASRAAARRSCSTSTATGGRRRASTARRCAACSTRSRTASPSGRSAAPTPCARSPTSRPGSSASSASSRRRSSPRSWTSQPFLDRAGAAARAPARALRRRARALQERRPARGGLAARRGARSPAPSCACRPRRARRPGRATRRARPGQSRGTPTSRRRRSRPRSTRRRASCSRRAREGMGRVVVEAFCRGRPVVGTRRRRDRRPRRGRRTGLLLPPDDAPALARALVRVLTDRRLAEELGPRARARLGALVRDARAVRRAGPGPGRVPRLTRCLAERTKRLLKHGVYRTVGEAVAGARRSERVERRPAPRAAVPQGQRRPHGPLTVSGGAVRRAAEHAARARLHGRRPRRRARPLLHGSPAAATAGADHVRRRLPRQPRQRGAGARSGTAIRP